MSAVSQLKHCSHIAEATASAIAPHWLRGNAS